MLDIIIQCLAHRFTHNSLFKKVSSWQYNLHTVKPSLFRGTLYEFWQLQYLYNHFCTQDLELWLHYQKSPLCFCSQPSPPIPNSWKSLSCSLILPFCSSVCFYLEIIILLCFLQKRISVLPTPPPFCWDESCRGIFVLILYTLE